MKQAIIAYWAANGAKIKAALGTLVKTAIVTAVGLYLALGVSIFDVSNAQWKGIAAVTIAALLKVLYQWAQPADIRYGIGSVTLPASPQTPHVPVTTVP